jgi:hypothetical protein
MVAEASKEDPVEEAKEIGKEEESGSHPPSYVMFKRKQRALQSKFMHLDLSVLLKEPSSGLLFVSNLYVNAKNLFFKMLTIFF